MGLKCSDAMLYCGAGRSGGRRWPKPVGWAEVKRLWGWLPGYVQPLRAAESGPTQSLEKPLNLISFSTLHIVAILNLI